MTLWFLRGLRRGVVTTDYPRRPEPTTAALATPPAFHARLLTADIAKALVEICPSRAFAFDGDVLRYDLGACTACGRCYAVAGEAGRPSGVVELAAVSRHHLVQRITIQPARS